MNYLHFRPRLLLASALGGALALAACTQPAPTENNQAEPANAEMYNELAPMEEPLVEDEADSGTAVTVAPVPAPAANAPAEEAAPLEEANTIEEDIRLGRDIRRVRWGNGWAWMRAGRILRTADLDGRNVAYFRPGQDQPFFVQRGDRAWSYDGGRPSREYGRDGRGRQPDARDRDQAETAARDARSRRNQAENARREAERRGNDRTGPRDGWRPGRPQPSPSPSPSASASPTPTPSVSAASPPNGRWNRDNRPGPTPESPRPQRTSRPAGPGPN